MSNDPEVLLSPLSRDIHVDKIRYIVEIYRLEDQAEWTIEVIDSHRTSTVWHDAFTSDKDALDYVLGLFQHQGPNALGSEGNIIPFPNRRNRQHNSALKTASKSPRRD